MKTICLISEEYPPETNFGGISTYHADLASLLVSHGYNVVVITKTFKKARIIHSGTQLLIIRVPSVLPISSWLDKLLGWKIAVFITIKRILKRKVIDLIETPDWKAEFILGVLFKRLLPPIIVRLHGCRAIIRKYDEQPISIGDKIVMHLEYYIMKHADYISSISSACLKETELTMSLSLRDKAIIIPNFTNYLCPIVNGNFSFMSKRFILFAGRIDCWKGVLVLAHAMRLVLEKYTDIFLVYAGRDIINKEQGCYNSVIIKNIIGEYSDNVIFVGQLERSELMMLFSKAFVTVLPSKFEPFGLCCIEAMQNGCPVIGSNRGGMNEIIEDCVNGYLVNPESSEEIREKIFYLLEHPSVRNMMSVNSMQCIKNRFSKEAVSASIINYYEEIMSKYRKNV